MTKSVKTLLIVMIGILLAAVIGSAFVLRPADQRMVEIVQDGKVLYQFDLNTAENQEITIRSPDGGMNMVEIADGEIRISHADCPDQTCVKTGVLYSESLPIVCLPHKLIVRFCE